MHKDVGMSMRERFCSRVCVRVCAPVPVQSTRRGAGTPWLDFTLSAHFLVSLSLVSQMRMLTLSSHASEIKWARAKSRT